MNESRLIGNILSEEMDNQVRGGGNSSLNASSSTNSGSINMEAILDSNSTISISHSDKLDLSAAIMRSTSAPPVLKENVSNFYASWSVQYCFFEYLRCIHMIIVSCSCL
jgi:hypothetical protein